MSKDKEKRMKNKIFFYVLELIFICLIIFSAVKIFIWNKENQTNSEILENIQESVTIDENNETKVDFATIKEKYPEVVGWIKVEGTDVNYPIVQANNNEYYLSHSIDKSDNGAGWIFADYNNKLDGTDKNIIIYGHNRRDGSMFSTLKNILNSDWYNNENNKYVTFITEQENTKYEVFSAYQIENEDYYLKTSFGGNKSFSEFTKKLKERSVKDFGTEVVDTDSILTLSTCANDNNYRVVLHAKKTAVQNNDEDIFNEWQEGEQE